MGALPVPRQVLRTATPGAAMSTKEPCPDLAQRDPDASVALTPITFGYAAGYGVGFLSSGLPRSPAAATTTEPAFRARCTACASCGLSATATATQITGICWSTAQLMPLATTPASIPAPA